MLIRQNWFKQLNYEHDHQNISRTMGLFVNRHCDRVWLSGVRKVLKPSFAEQTIFVPVKDCSQILKTVTVFMIVQMAKLSMNVADQVKNYVDYIEGSKDETVCTVQLNQF